MATSYDPPPRRKKGLMDSQSVAPQYLPAPPMPPPPPPMDPRERAKRDADYVYTPTSRPKLS